MFNLELDENLLDKKAGSYKIGKATALSDFTLLAKAQEYKRRLSGNLFPITEDDILKRIPNIEGTVVSRKVDGEFCLVFYDGKQLLSINPGGTVRLGLPCFAEAATLLKKAKVKSGIFAGELYIRKEKGERERVHDIVRVIRKPKNAKILSDVGLALFDAISINEEEFGIVEAMKKLDDIFSAGKLVNAVDYEVIDSSKGVKRLYDKWVLAENSEGLVVRSEQLPWFKAKPTHTIDCAVLAFSESSNERTGLLHDLLVGLVRDDGTFHTMAHVGGGFKEDERRELFEKLKKMVVSSDFIEVNSEHTAYEFVNPEMVIEMKCLDVISIKSRGDTINRMVCSFDKKEKAYKAIRRMPFVSIISPQFERIRVDKEPVKEDVSVSQVADLVEIKDIDASTKDFELPKSELKLREVYVKHMGEKIMVRKLIIWKTNKEASGEYPPFIFYYTDFSSGRKDPLDRDIKPANTYEKALEIFEDVRADVVKKGWERGA